MTEMEHTLIRCMQEIPDPPPHTTKDTSEHGRKCKCPAAHRHKAAEVEKAAVWE